MIIASRIVSVDDKRIVAWRKSNKVGIKAKAKLNCDLERGDEVITGFALRFLYTKTVPSLEQREIQTSDKIKTNAKGQQNLKRQMLRGTKFL